MSDPIAKTKQGEVRGREKDGVLLFAGIPYAAPPTGPRRFRPPEPHEPWREVRDARRFGPAAPQPKGTGLTAVPNLRWDEAACLTLNVCTPALDDARRPVLVWIHGGGFRTGQGSTPWYNGRSFASRGDVVVVSFNYRLGALGFAQLDAVGGEAFASSGLAGSLDQVAALAWVRDNIAGFGGDPERVSIAGESAGGMSVGTLLGMPAARGLFRAAIPQSGAAHHVSPLAAGRALADELLDATRAQSVEALQSLPAERILEAQVELEALSNRQAFRERFPTALAGMPFVPVVEGRALPQHPLDAVRAGDAREVRLLTGTNRDEWTLFAIGQQVDERKLARLAARHFAEPEQALARYREEWPKASPRDLAIAITTDEVFRIPALRLAEAQHAAGGDAWVYLFSWASRAFAGQLGSTHALEIPFAFDTLDQPGVDLFLGEGESPQALADAMHAAWTAFVRDGDPACPEVGGAWPRYTPERRAVLEFGDEIGLREDPFGGTRALWDGRR